MLAFLLSCLVVALLSLIGLAAQCLMYNTRSIGAAEILRSGSFGLCIVSLPTLNLSRAGLPVNSFAAILSALMILISVTILGWRRPKVHLLSAFGAISVIGCALVWVGRPLLAHGFDWVAFSNGDAHFYRNNAMRLLNHGFYELPKANLLVTDRDDSAFTLFGTPLQGGYRPLFDIFLAFVGAVSRIDMTKIYMPVVAALFALEASAAVIFGISILPPAKSTRLKIALLLISMTAILAASSAIAVGGELGPQIIGVTLLANLLAIPGLSADRRSQSTWLRWAFGSAILFSALLEAYAEMAPFLIGTVLVVVLMHRNLALEAFRSKRRLIAACALIIGGTVAITLNAQLIGTLYLIEFTSSGTSTSVGGFQYPAYLIPTGPAVLWGLFPVSASQQSGADQPLIAGGLILLALYLVSVLRISRSMPRLLGINVVVTALACLLFVKRADFGLYKLTMYAQPFLWPVLISSAMLLHIKWFRLAAFLTVFVVVAKSGSTSKYYIDRSMDRFSAKKDDFVEVRRATADALLDRIANLATQVDGRDVILATSNDLLEKYVQDMLRPRFLVTPNFRTGPLLLQKALIEVPFLDKLSQLALPLSEIRYKYYTTYPFTLPVGRGIASNVQVDRRPFVFNDHKKPVVIIPGTDTTVFNLCQLSSVSGSDTRQLYRDDNGRNLLAPMSIPLTTEASTKYSAEAPEFVGPDNFHGGLMFASPNILAFRILNPSSKVRLLLDYTSTLNEFPYKTIPRIEIIGTQKVALPVVGEGRARLLSDPVMPLSEGNENYLFIHIDQPLFRFRSTRKGLAALYGGDIQTDFRQLAGFVREVSAIGSDTNLRDCQSNPAPEAFLSNVPFYSGLFEDGWLSPDVLLRGRGKEVSSLVISGSSPWFGGRSNVLVVTAGSFRKSMEIRPGHSVITVNFLRPTSGPVLLHFARSVGPLVRDQRRLSFLADHVQLR